MYKSPKVIKKSEAQLFLLALCKSVARFVICSLFAAVVLWTYDMPRLLMVFNHLRQIWPYAFAVWVVMLFLEHCAVSMREDLRVRAAEERNGRLDWGF